MGKQTVNLLVAQIKTMIKERGIQEFTIALNNAFAHGEILEGVYGPIEQVELDLIFEGIEKIHQAANTIEPC